MKFAGKLYAGNLFLGHVCANSLHVLKRIASQKCNRYFMAFDKMILHRADDKEVDELSFTRINRLSPDNTVIRGTWN